MNSSDNGMSQGPVPNQVLTVTKTVVTVYPETDSEEVAARLQKSALKSLGLLKSWIVAMETGLAAHKGGAFSSYWLTVLEERTAVVVNDICRANGAVLVRGKPQIMNVSDVSEERKQ